MIGTSKLVQQIKLRPDNNINLILKASICHKSKLPPRKPPRFPFEKESYDILHMWKDPFTKHRFNENSRIVQIEGNIKSGKHEFAHQLAKELDMHVMPDVDIDDYYINEHGFDYAALNPMLPERLRNCTRDMYHENPARHSVVHMQFYYFKLRFLQYCKAMRHLFNTGQGVILVRSVFTERVFVEAMHNVGWLPTGYIRDDGVQFYDWKTRYIYTRSILLAHVLQPHLTIYLDTPVDACMDMIKNSDDPMIANSKALSPEFLEAIEGAYNDHVLNTTQYYGHLAHFDHPKTKTIDEIQDVIDELEKLDFNYDPRNTRFYGWFPETTWLWYISVRRHFTSTQPMKFNHWFFQPYFDIAGLGDCIDHEDTELRQMLHEANVGPVGEDYDRLRDPLTNSIPRIILNKETLDQKWNRWIKSDFL